MEETCYSSAESACAQIEPIVEIVSADMSASAQKKGRPVDARLTHDCT